MTCGKRELLHRNGTLFLWGLFRRAGAGPVGATLECRFISIWEVWISVFILSAAIIVFFTKTYESMGIGQRGAG